MLKIKLETLLYILVISLIIVLFIKYIKKSKKKIEPFFQNAAWQNDVQSVTFHEKKEHNFNGSNKRRPTAKFWIGGRTPLEVAEANHLNDTYNQVQLLGDATKAIICEKDWKEIKNHETDKKCEVITTKELHTFKKGNQISSIKVYPENTPTSMVKMTGRRQGRTKVPETIYVYHADHLHWRNNIRRIDIDGNLEVKAWQDTDYRKKNVVIGGGELNNDSLKDDIDSFKIKSRQPTPINWLEKFLEADPIEEKEYPYIEFYTKEKKPSYFKFIMESDIPYINFDDLYNTITLSENVNKVIVCKKNWFEVSNHETSDECEVYTKAEHGTNKEIIIFGSKHRLSSLRIVDPVNPETVGAHVTLSGFKEHNDSKKKNNPRSIKLYQADKLNWENVIDGVKVYGNLRFKLCDELTCKDNDAGRQFDSRSDGDLIKDQRDKYSTLVMLRGQKKDEEVLDEEFTKLSDKLHVTLFKVEKGVRQKIEFRVSGGIVNNLNFNDVYENVEIGDNVEFVELSNKDSHESGQTIKRFTPIWNEDFMQSKFKIDFNYDLSSVKITKKNQYLPAFVTLYGRKPGHFEQPMRLEVAHADTLDWNDKNITEVIVHNTDVWFYKKENLKDNALQVGFKKDLNPQTFDKGWKPDSISMFPKMKVNSIEKREMKVKTEKVSKDFIKIITTESNVDSTFTTGIDGYFYGDNDNYIIPPYTGSVKFDLNLNFENKYKYLQLSHGSTKVLITYTPINGTVAQSVILYDYSVYNVDETFGNIKTITVLDDGSQFYERGAGRVVLFDRKNKNEDIPDKLFIRRLALLNMIGKISHINPSVYNITYETQDTSNTVPEDKDEKEYLMKNTDNDVSNLSIKSISISQDLHSNFLTFKYIEVEPVQTSEPIQIEAFTLEDENVNDKEEILVFIPPDEFNNLNLTKDDGQLCYNKFKFGGGATEVRIMIKGDVAPTIIKKITNDKNMPINPNIKSIEVIADGDNGFQKGSGFIELISSRGNDCSDRPNAIRIRKGNMFNWTNKTFNVSGKNMHLKFYSEVFGYSHLQKDMDKKGVEFSEDISNMSSVYKVKESKVKTAFFKKVKDDPAENEYMQFIPDTNIGNLNINDTYNQFKFMNGAGKVQMCTKEWHKIKKDCYSRIGPVECDDCKIYEVDPKFPNKIHPITTKMNDLSSVRVYDDGFQGFEEHMGYVQLMGKKSSQKQQPGYINIRNADRMDWNDDDIHMVYTPDSTLQFFQHPEFKGERFDVLKSKKEKPVEARDGKKYSSLKVDSTCSDSDQSCHTCQYDEDCRGVYTSATWKKNFFRDEALNYDNSFNGKCMNGTCVACIEHDDCSAGYECCSGSECNNWKTNKVYGACHQAD